MPSESFPRLYDNKVGFKIAKNFLAISKLEKVLEFVSKTGAEEDEVKESSGLKAELSSILNGYKIRTLCAILDKHMSRYEVFLAAGKQFNIEQHVSCYISGTHHQHSKMKYFCRIFGSIVFVGHQKSKDCCIQDVLSLRKWKT